MNRDKLRYEINDCCVPDVMQSELFLFEIYSLESGTIRSCEKVPGVRTPRCLDSPGHLGDARKLVSRTPWSLDLQETWELLQNLCPGYPGVSTPQETWELL